MPGICVLTNGPDSGTLVGSSSSKLGLEFKTCVNSVTHDGVVPPWAGSLSALHYPEIMPVTLRTKSVLCFPTEAELTDGRGAKKFTSVESER